MPWVMAAMAAAQMLQSADNADRQRKVDAAGIRYSPWTGISKLPFSPDKTVDIAQQGVTGIMGQQEGAKQSEFQDKLGQAQLDYYGSLTKKPVQGGSMMNAWGEMPQQNQNGYSDPNMWRQALNGRRF